MLRPICAVAVLATACLTSPAKAETTLCTEITTLPTTINVQGTYCMKGDLSTSLAAGSAITVAANNVTIDCNGRKLGGLGAGVTTRASGIQATNRSNITVRGCNIRGFYRGIVLEGTGSGHVVEHNALDGITYLGMRVHGAGATIRGNRIVNVGGTDDTNGTYGGILLNGSGGRIVDNDISGLSTTGPSSLRGILATGPRNVIESNRLSDLVAPNAGQVKAIMLLGSPDTELPMQAVLRENSVLVPPGTQGYAVWVKTASSVCRNNDLLGFDGSWLEAQASSALDACGDAGGNVTK
ncbi:right-handed parallel beta-helix repeat-containing protein [Agrilutibacter solisilvae]|uniref:Right-handed parallel beta-helix repeat-containing protein n=1 Tax=Agrilutibacter solisilvae TaxID=2763317 RepID=A0A974Y0A6_9GAMM|nr:right-handed parallel beta-helix repeat-containing protein [Lysobacter solisilvae]QSX78959.1 right-handed parallel beta-helix repeat-containing protein [Lysobacter solisilvae]